MKFVIAFVGMISVSAVSFAQENSCVLLQKLATNLGCIGATSPTPNSLGEKTFTDEMISNTFGGEACVTAKTLDETKVSLKKECQSWLNDQKKDLGSRFVTGSCKPSCIPCPEALQKCSVKGEVRYRLDNRAQ